jgi:WD40 repeat protein
MTRHARQLVALGIPMALTLAAHAQSLQVLWSANHGAQVSAVAFSPDSTRVASGSSYAYGSQAWAKLWNAANGQPVDTYDDFGIADSIVDVAIAPPSQLLAVGYTYPDFYNGYARTDLFDIAAHAAIAQYNGSHLSFSGDGSLLAAATLCAAFTYMILIPGSLSRTFTRGITSGVSRWPRTARTSPPARRARTGWCASIRYLAVSCSTL